MLKRKQGLVLYIIISILICIIIFPKQYKLNYQNPEITIVDENNSTFYIYGKGYYYIYPINEIKNSVYIYSDSETEISEEDFDLYYNNFKIATFELTKLDENNFLLNIHYDKLKIALIIIVTLLLEIIVTIFINLLFVRNKVVTSIKLFKIQFHYNIIFKLILSSVSILATLYISLYKLTSFLTVDEERAFTENMFLENDVLRHWQMGSSRLNYTIMGTIWSVFKMDFLKTDHMAKLLHWFLGIIIITIISLFIAKKLCSKVNTSKILLFTVFFVEITLCPVTLIALKNYNYNLFSLLFGVLAFIILIYSLEEKKEFYAWIALAFATMGTMEKMIAYPLIVFAMIYLLWIRYKDKQCSFGELIVVELKSHLFIIFISECFILYVQYFLRGDKFPNITILDVIIPVFDFPYTVVKKIISGNLYTSYCIGIVFNFMLVLAGYLFFRLCEKILKINKLYKCFKYIETCSFAIIIVGGSIYEYIVIYKERDFIDHYISLFICCNTTILIFLLVLSVLRAIGKIEYPLYYDIILVFTVLCIPAGYALGSISGNSMYYNLWVLILTVSVTILFYKYFMSEFDRRINWISLVLMLSIVIEVLPFQPAFIIYIPFWARGAKFDQKVELDARVIGISQTGWGEDILLAGEAIEKYLKKNNIIYDEINMYTSYPGEWLGMKDNYIVHWMPGFIRLGESITEYELEDIAIEENDFYVFCRNGVTSRSCMEFSVPPKEYEPLITVRQANMTKVWIYTGDQIKDYLYEMRETLMSVE